MKLLALFLATITISACAWFNKCEPTPKPTDLPAGQPIVKETPKPTPIIVKDLEAKVEHKK